MNDELKQIENGLTILEANQKQIKMLKNKANYITNELEIFENNYIKSNWEMHVSNCSCMPLLHLFSIFFCYVNEKAHTSSYIMFLFPFSELFE